MGRHKTVWSSTRWDKRNQMDPEYVEWRYYIRQRDGRKCQMPMCSKTTTLVCHHIQRWADYPTLRFDKNNGICLCREHHDEIRNKENAYAPLFMQIVLRNKLLYEQRIQEGKIRRTKPRKYKARKING